MLSCHATIQGAVESASLVSSVALLAHSTAGGPSKCWVLHEQPCAMEAAKLWALVVRFRQTRVMFFDVPLVACDSTCTGMCQTSTAVVEYPLLMPETGRCLSCCTPYVAEFWEQTAHKVYEEQLQYCEAGLFKLRRWIQSNAREAEVHR
jgi:hypothetical protein